MSMASNGNSSSVIAIIVSLIIIGLLFFTVYMINASRRLRYKNAVSAKCINLNRQESSRIGDVNDGHDDTSVTYNPEFSAMIDGVEHIFRGIFWSSAVPKFAEGDVVTLRYLDGDLGPVTPISEEEYNAKAEADGRVTYKNFYIEGYSKFKGLLATAIVAWALAVLIIVIITCT